MTVAPAPTPTRDGALAVAAARSSRTWNIPDRSVVLVGHRQLLSAVYRTLRAGGPALVCTTAGRVGAGATTAIVEFAHRHACDYDVAWWIPASDPELVPIHLAALAEALGVTRVTDDAEAATSRLLHTLRHRDRYLLVFDNAESPRQLARFLPTGSGDTVLISSDPEWQAYATAHRVEPFTRSESVALLRARRPDLRVDAAARVAAALDDVPLAVDPMAGLLADTHTDVEELLCLLVDRLRRTETPNPVTATWEVAFDRLATHHPAALALLTLAAWLGPEPLPLRIVTDHPRELPEVLADVARNPAALARLADGLSRRGLAQITAHGIALHRVPAALLVLRTAGEYLGEGADGWAVVAVRLLRAAVPADADAPATWMTWRRLLPLVLAATDPVRRLDTATADAGWLLHCAARFLRARGQLRAATTLSQDADDLCATTCVRQPSEKMPAACARPVRLMSPRPMEARS